MSFPSCIKIPVSKNSSGTEANSHNNNGLVNNKESVSYNELMSVANKVFGPGRWSHSVTSQTVDYVEYVMGKYQIGCAAFVKVQLADGTFHEDMGYSATESSVKGSAIFSARSSSISLALKKALLCFGGAIEEKINEITSKTLKVKQDNNKLNEEKNNEIGGKNQKATGSCIQEAKSVESTAPRNDIVSEIKPPSKTLQTVSTPKRNKSPKPKESEDAFAPTIDDIEVIMEDECQENIIVTLDPLKASHKDVPPSTIMTEDEIRLERKRKQKQKQEEYKKLMREKQMKSDDKPNPRY